MGRGISLTPNADALPRNQQVSALHDTLDQLIKGGVPSATVELDHFHISPSLLEYLTFRPEWRFALSKCVFYDGPPHTAITHRLPTLTGLHIPDVSLTDDLLLPLLLYCRSLTQLSVLNVDLKTSHAQWAVERWEMLSTEQSVSFAQAEKLPQPLRSAYAVHSREPDNVQTLVILPSLAISSNEVRGCHCHAYCCMLTLPLHGTPCMHQTCIGIHTCMTIARMGR